MAQSSSAELKKATKKWKREASRLRREIRGHIWWIKRYKWLRKYRMIDIGLTGGFLGLAATILTIAASLSTIIGNYTGKEFTIADESVAAIASSHKSVVTIASSYKPIVEKAVTTIAESQKFVAAIASSQEIIADKLTNPQVIKIVQPNYSTKAPPSSQCAGDKDAELDCKDEDAGECSACKTYVKKLINCHNAESERNWGSHRDELEKLKELVKDHNKHCVTNTNAQQSSNTLTPQ